MSKTHKYIKQLYKEWNTIWLERERNRLKEIINNYNKELTLALRTRDENEIEKIKMNIKNHEKLLKLIKKVKYILYKELDE